MSDGLSASMLHGLATVAAAGDRGVPVGPMGSHGILATTARALQTRGLIVVRPGKRRRRAYLAEHVIHVAGTCPRVKPIKVGQSVVRTVDAGHVHEGCA